MRKIFLFILLSVIVFLAVYYFPTAKKTVTPLISNDRTTPAVASTPLPTPELPSIDDKSDLKNEIKNTGKVDYQKEVQTLKEAAGSI